MMQSIADAAYADCRKAECRRPDGAGPGRRFRRAGLANPHGQQPPVEIGIQLEKGSRARPPT
jgi:hypothetical protein